MYRFNIYFENTLIGWTNLELGDAPMGVAFGKFVAAPEYSTIQSQVIASSISHQPFPSLSVHLSDGTVVEPSSGVTLTDYSPDLGPDGIEISVLGLAYPQYAQIFPEHVAAYEQLFPSGV